MASTVGVLIMDTLYSANPKDLVLKINTGDGDAAVVMGLLCLSGLGGKQDLDQASSYFVKAKQLGAKDADVLIAYINECNGRMNKAIDAYVGKEPLRKKGNPIAGILRKRFKKVSTERKRLRKLITEYGLPECPMDTSLTNLLESLESGKKSLSDVCSILSSCDDSEHWCEDTAWLFYEEGEWELAGIWMKKSHSDEKWLSVIQDKIRKEISVTPEAVEIEGSSLLGRKLAFNVLSESGASHESIKRALTEWGQECNQIRKEQCRLEEEKCKKEEQERARQERLKKAKEPLKKESKPAEKPKETSRIDYHNLFDKGLFWFEESITLKDEAILPFLDRISIDAKKGDAKAKVLLGYHMYLQEEYSSALSFYNEASSVLQKKGTDNVAVAGLLFDMALVFSRLGNRMNAVDRFENCLKLLDESKEDSSEEKAMTYYHMSWARFWMGHTRIGLECLNNALSLLEKNKAKHALGIGIVYDCLAYWNSYPSSYDDALKYHIKALEAYNTCNDGPVKSAKLLECHNSIGRDYYLLKNYPKAAEFFKFASNQSRVNQMNEIGSYDENSCKVKCTFDQVRINKNTVSFFFRFDSVFNNTEKLVAEGSCLGNSSFKRIRNNKASFSVPENLIRSHKYFTFYVDIYRFFGKKLEEKDDLDLFQMGRVHFDFSRKRAFLFWGSVRSVSRE